MKKRISAIILAAVFCLAMLPGMALAASSYQNGVVSVEVKGLSQNTDYPLIAIKNSSGAILALGSGTTNDKGTLTASITTGKLSDPTSCKVSVYTQDGKLATTTTDQKSIVDDTPKSGGSTGEPINNWGSSSSTGGGGGGGAAATSYAVTVEKAENGTVTVSKAAAYAGNVVTLTVKPDAGYELDTLKVLDKDGKEVDLTKKSETSYSYAQPRSKVSVEATFKLIGAPSKAAETAAVETVAAERIVLTINSKDVVIDGETVANDVAPIIRNDRAMLPIRLIAEALGAKVDWDDAETRMVTITKGDLKVILVIDSATAFVNGVAVQLDSPAFIENDRTYVPVRFVAEALNATVDWDEEDQQVTITPAPAADEAEPEA